MEEVNVKVEAENIVFYTVDDDYIEYLRNIDDKVLFNKPELNTRPYAGFLVKFNGFDYLVPLSSQIKKSNNVTAVIPNRLTETQKAQNAITKEHPEFIATIKFNNMIPVREDVINKINIPEKTNNKKEEDYKILLIKEILFCSENKERLLNKANKTMKIFNENRPNMNAVILSCCNFPVLEKACTEYKK